MKRLQEMIRTYTREAGVRNLEREIAKVARKAVTTIVKKEAEEVVVTTDNLDDFLGVKKFRYGLAEEKDQIGVVTGLAYTSVGGELLHIEALRLPGKGRMKTTGKLGDVMKESIDAASSYVRSISPQIGVKPPQFDRIRHSRPRPRWRDAQRRPKCRIGYGHLYRVGADPNPGAQRYCDDRRGQSCGATQCQSVASRKSCWPHCVAGSKRF